jgi:hypothetical protein
MKRWLPLLLVAAAIGVITPQVGFAQSNTMGINLAWNDCGSFGAVNKNFACNSNNGSNLMYVSFVAPGGLDTLVSAEAVIELVTNQATLPTWWNLQSGGCRSGDLSANFGFVAGPFNCQDPWGGNGAGGITGKVAGDPQVTDPSHLRIDIVVAVSAAQAINPDSTLEYYMAAVAINNKATVASACTGCDFPACIRLESVALLRTSLGGVARVTNIFNPPAGGNQQITWQAPVIGADCNFVPTRNQTWGQIKSLYR